MKIPFAPALIIATLVAPSLTAEPLTRVATVPLGAEITGLFLDGDDLFFNVQHPDEDLGTIYARASVGVFANADFEGGEQEVPKGDDKKLVKSSLGPYQILVQEGGFDKIGRISGEGGEIKISRKPDFNAFVGTSKGQGYLFTNWEDRPGGMSRIKMTRGVGGQWDVHKDGTEMLDFSGVEGTWRNCFGTLSPWNTPLSAEELYFDDTADWNDASHAAISGVANLEAYLGYFPNPYRYGYIVEMQAPVRDPSPVKHFAQGRFSHENSVVMPDQKTVYLSDDGTDVVFFKFIAERAGDLSSGTLYAAQMKQVSEPGSSAADAAFQITWIELAYGSNDEIESWIAQYDGITQADFVEGRTSYISQDEIDAWARGEADDNRVAFLESRKAAAAKGATAEFRKMEGVNINYSGAADGSVPYMYLAMSEVSRRMSDDEGDIRVEKNKCGVVYELRLDSTYNVAKMVPVIAGGPYDKHAEVNSCDVNNLANPDNIVVLPSGSVLVGEDSSKHENNALWLFTPPRLQK